MLTSGWLQISVRAVGDVVGGALGSVGRGSDDVV